jgi:hypothetical protein
MRRAHSSYQALNPCEYKASAIGWADDAIQRIVILVTMELSFATFRPSG